MGLVVLLETYRLLYCSGFESWRHWLASIEPIIITTKRVRDIFFEFPILRNYINLTWPNIKWRRPIFEQCEFSTGNVMNFEILMSEFARLVSNPGPVELFPVNCLPARYSNFYSQKNFLSEFSNNRRRDHQMFRYLKLNKEYCGLRPFWKLF